MIKTYISWLFFFYFFLELCRLMETEHIDLSFPSSITEGDSLGFIIQTTSLISWQIAKHKKPEILTSTSIHACNFALFYRDAYYLWIERNRWITDYNIFEVLDRHLHDKKPYKTSAKSAWYLK